MNINILKQIAKNSDMPIYILNNKMVEEWSNCRKPFKNYLIKINREKLQKEMRTIESIQNLNKVLRLGCNDGNTIVITPLIENNITKKLYVEIYSPEREAEMYTKSSYSGVANFVYESIKNEIYEDIMGDKHDSDGILSSLFADSFDLNYIPMLLINEIELSKVDAGSSLNSVCDRINKFDPQKIHINKSIDENIFISSNAEIFEFLIANLIVNTLKYTGSYNNKKTIFVSTRLEPNCVIITVSSSFIPPDDDLTMHNKYKVGKKMFGEMAYRLLCTNFCKICNGNLSVYQDRSNDFKAVMMLPLYDSVFANK